MRSALRNPQSALPWPFVPAVSYTAFAIYLYWTYFSGFADWDWLLPLNAGGAALGAYVLSRRWATGEAGPLLAGLLYGFGPFLLAWGRYPPALGLLPAVVPWLFVPAAFLGRERSPWPSLPLWLLPFVILAVFHVSAGQRLPAAQIRAVELVGAIAPRALLDRSTVLFGVYHLPVATLVVGLATVGKKCRYDILLLLAAGLALTGSGSFLNTDRLAWLGAGPILWLSLPMVWCAVLSGIGLQRLIEAGPADRKWVLAAAIVLGLLAIATLFLAAQCFQVFLSLGDGYARLFVQTATIHLAGAAATGFLYFLMQRNLHLPWLRRALLYAALGLDILLTARYILAQIL